MPRHIDVLGPLPPPFGGVSIHIVRFLELVRGQGLTAEGHPYTGTTRSGKVAKALQAVGMVFNLYLKTSPGARGVLHVHYGGLGYFLALAPLLKLGRARKVITFHSVRVIQDLEGKPEWIRRWTMGLLDDFDLFVPVREEIGEELRRIGLNRPEMITMPAFLPPAEAERDLDRLPGDLASALEEGGKSNRLAVCCAAYYLGPGYGKDDLYGVEELAEALVVLDSKLDRPLDVWILTSNRPDSEAARQAEKKVRALTEGLVSVQVKVVYGAPLIPVMARSAGFLRPSREDGDSVAIREAMSMGLPVLASDVVRRPEGTVTFTLGGGEHLAGELETFLADLKPVPPGEVRPVRAEDPERLAAFVGKVVGEG